MERPRTRPGEVQRRSLLCDGAIVFDDTGELRADGSAVPPRRAPAERLAVGA